MFNFKLAFLLIFLLNTGYRTPDLSLKASEIVNSSIDPIIGEWKLMILGQRDAYGNPLSEEIQQTQREMRDAFGFGGAGEEEVENDSVDYDERFIFNSSGEYFFSDAGYGGIYLKSDSTLKVSDREYKILALNDSVLSIIDKPGAIQILDAYTFRSYRRINDKDLASSRTKMKELLLGTWTGDHAQQVSVQGRIYHSQRVSIVDTTSEKSMINLNIKIDSQEMKFETKEGALAGTYEYDIADSVVIAQHTPAFIILNITSTSLTLLGPHDNRTLSTLILTFKKTEM